jgi:hypothetical protein
MKTRTRYFVIASLLVLVVGIGTGLLAYYVGVPGGFLVDRDGPEELRYVTRNAAVVAFADVREIMASEIRQKIRRATPLSENGQAQFQDQTGINIESDVDRVVASLETSPGGETVGVVLARGRFSDVKIETLMRERGAQIQEYKGKRVIEHQTAGRAGDTLALTFLEPGLVAVGGGVAVRTAIDLQTSGEDVTKNAELMNLVRSLVPGNAWAIGRIDALRADQRLPQRLASQLPGIEWFAVSGRVDSEVRASVRVDARDAEAANNLREVVRGFLALARLQSGERPEIQALVQSVQLGGEGNTVSLTFAIPAAAFDALGTARQERQQPQTR